MIKVFNKLLTIAIAPVDLQCFKHSENREKEKAHVYYIHNSSIPSVVTEDGGKEQLI